MTWLTKHYAILGVVATVIGLLVHLVLVPAPRPEPQLPSNLPVWEIPQASTDEILRQALSVIGERNPWGVGEVLEVAEVDEAAEAERLAREAQEAAARRAAREAEARRLALTWRFMGSIEFGLKTAGFFVSGLGEARYVEVGEELVGQLVLIQLREDLATLAVPEEFEANQPEIRVQLFRAPEFVHDYEPDQE